MPGTADYHTAPTRERLQHTMQVLARWHLAARQFVPHQNEAIWFASQPDANSPGLQERLQSIRRWDVTCRERVGALLRNCPDSPLKPLMQQIWERFDLSASKIAWRMEQYVPVRVPIQPALRDIWHDHLLFTNDELTGLIDASVCRRECVATDLARLLGSLHETGGVEWAIALSTYNAIRPLSDREMQLVRVFHDSGTLLSGATWLDWLLIQQRTFPDWNAVKRRLEAVARNMSRLEF